MLTIYVLRGLQASGKTTWAKRKLAEHPGACKRVNKDDLRSMLDDSKWTGENEKFVINLRDQIIIEALRAGKHVIVDDTNGNPKHIERFRRLAADFRGQHGADCKIEIVEFEEPLETCITRDLARPKSVGERVIRRTWKQFFARPVQAVHINPELQTCVVVDIDGTIALCVDRGPFEWSKVGSDVPNEPVCRFVRSISYPVIFVSGRDECCRPDTHSWLVKHILCGRNWPEGAPESNFSLYMRPAGDCRDDRIVNREIYEREIRGKYNVAYVLDDRNKVVEMWRSLGLACFQVAEGDF